MLTPTMQPAWGAPCGMGPAAAAGSSMRQVGVARKLGCTLMELGDSSGMGWVAACIAACGSPCALRQCSRLLLLCLVCRSWGLTTSDLLSWSTPAASTSPSSSGPRGSRPLRERLWLLPLLLPLLGPCFCATGPAALQPDAPAGEGRVRLRALGEGWELGSETLLPEACACGCMCGRCNVIPDPQSLLSATCARGSAIKWVVGLGGRTHRARSAGRGLDGLRCIIIAAKFTHQ